MCANSLQLCPTLWTLWTVAHQGPLSMGFSRQEYWSGLPCPPTGDLPDPGIELVSLMSPALVGGFFTTSAIWEGLLAICQIFQACFYPRTTTFAIPCTWNSLPSKSVFSVLLSPSWDLEQMVSPSMPHFPIYKRRKIIMLTLKPCWKD